MLQKCKKEPLRCLKCHSWGHMAHNCLAQHNTCGTCAQCHRMDTCTNTARPHCVSCSMAGHACWDRSCPVSVHKCSDMNDRLDENNMLYFPTSEVWTQVREPPKMVYVMPPPPQDPTGSRQNGGPMQSMLPWQSYGSAHRGTPLPPHQAGGQVCRNFSENAGPSPSPLLYV